MCIVQGAAVGRRTNQRLNDMPVRAILDEMYSPKLVIKQIFIERKWATFYRFEFSPNLYRQTGIYDIIVLLSAAALNEKNLRKQISGESQLEISFH